MGWIANIKALQASLVALQVTDSRAYSVPCDEAFALWKAETEVVRGRANTVYLIGNGASSSMASHMAADLAKNALVHTQVFTDLALITAIANDMSYDQVFAEPLRRRTADGDMLVAISSSGCSPNILRGVEEAQQRNLFVVTLSAMREDNPLRKMGDLNFYVPAMTYGISETNHTTVLHHWMDLMLCETVVLEGCDE